MDWQVGDHALLYIAGWHDCPVDETVIHGGMECPPLGSVRVVAEITPTQDYDGYRCGCSDLVFSDGSGAVSWRCKKVTPDTEDTFDREVIAALTGEPVHVPQHDALHNSCQCEVSERFTAGQLGSAG